MKALIIILTLILGSQGLDAQTFDEIFKQKTTQKKYLLQQIAALQLYVGYAQKGYSIARQGINAITELTNGELNLHSSYFSSLKAVNPVFKNYTEVADIISLQIRIMKIYKSLLPALKKSDLLNDQEMRLVNHVFNQVTKDCVSLTDDLIEVTTSGRLAMTDDERLERIGVLYTTMQKNYVFAKDFSNQALTMAAYRRKTQRDASTMKKFHQIN